MKSETGEVGVKNNTEKRRVWGLSACIVVGMATFGAADWPQLQSDQYRTGRTTETVAGPYRLRWMWLGPQTVIRNRLSNSSWTTAPTIDPGEVVANKTSVPSSVPFTFSLAVQPIVVQGRVYIGDMDGMVYAINVVDGQTLWTADNPGGTLASVAYCDGVVVVGSISGYIRGYDALAGGPARWSVATGGGITAAPLSDGQNVYVGSQDGCVYCIRASDGVLLWTSVSLGAPIVAPAAMDDASVYVCAENMRVFKLRVQDGVILSSRQVSGQSFHSVWPVIFSSYVFVEAAGIPEIGSEYVGEMGWQQTAGPHGDATSRQQEEEYILTFLAGGQAGTRQGGWLHASRDWKHLTVLRRTDLSEPFVVPCMPFEGCGTPPAPPVVDNRDRVLSYRKTKYPTLIGQPPSFGTNFIHDISAINLDTGRWIPIDNGRYANVWPWESDNLYGLTVAGDRLMMRQYFRGTMVLDLAQSVYRLVQAAVYNRDGATWPADVVYVATTGGMPSTTMPSWSGRIGPIVSHQKVFFVEPYALVALERHQ